MAVGNDNSSIRLEGPNIHTVEPDEDGDPYAGYESVAATTWLKRKFLIVKF